MKRRITDLWQAREVRRKILITLGLLVVYRLVAKIPIPGIDLEIADLALSISGDVSEGISSMALVLDVFTGGGISGFSVLIVGIYGYLIARFVITLFLVLFPSQRRKYDLFPHEGQRKLDRWTSFVSVLVTIPVAASLLNLYRASFALCLAGYADWSTIQSGEISTTGMLIPILAIIAGAKFSEWIADRISEQGIGSGGVWLIVAVNILAAIPRGVSRLWRDAQWRWVDLGVFVVVTLVLIIAFVQLLNARRIIAVMYPGRRVGNRIGMPLKGKLPLMVSSGRQQPFMLAQGLILFPSIAALPFLCAANQGLRELANNVIGFFTLSNPWLWVVYFLLVAALTYYHRVLFVASQNYAMEMRKVGARIAGVAPGKPTNDYIGRVGRRIALPGSVLVGLLVVLPLVVDWLAGSNVFLFTPVGLIMVVIPIRNSLYVLETDLKSQGYGY